jgi:hypothetical protein
MKGRSTQVAGHKDLDAALLSRSMGRPWCICVHTGSVVKRPPRMHTDLQKCVASIVAQHSICNVLVGLSVFWKNNGSGLSSFTLTIFSTLAHAWTQRRCSRILQPSQHHRVGHKHGHRQGRGQGTDKVRSLLSLGCMVCSVQFCCAHQLGPNIQLWLGSCQYNVPYFQ